MRKCLPFARSYFGSRHLTISLGKEPLFLDEGCSTHEGHGPYHVCFFIYYYMRWEYIGGGQALLPSSKRVFFAKRDERSPPPMVIRNSSL